MYYWRLVVRNGRGRIITAAERLVARHGIAGVSVRDIVAAAALHNPSAIHYHFGSKAGLIQAILEHRRDAVDPQRLRRLRELDRTGGGKDLRPLVEAMVYPFAAYLQPGSHYARFLAQVFNSPTRDHLTALALPVQQGIKRLQARIFALLRPLPPAVRTQRFQLASGLLMQAVAEHEQQLENGQQPAIPTMALAADLVEAIIAVLGAPLSPVTRQSLHARRRRPRAALKLRQRRASQPTDKGEP